eukprot:UC1_evm1s1961
MAQSTKIPPGPVLVPMSSNTSPAYSSTTIDAAAGAASSPAAPLEVVLYVEGATGVPAYSAERASQGVCPCIRMRLVSDSPDRPVWSSLWQSTSVHRCAPDPVFRAFRVFRIPSVDYAINVTVEVELIDHEPGFETLL